MRAETKTVVAVAVAALLAVAILVALSSRYEVVTTSRFPHILRVDRWTGKTWTLSRDKPFRWVEVDEP